MSNIVELLEKHSIQIPTMQRDYAYGRARERDKRNGLISSIFDVLTGNVEKVRLNYIYGAPEVYNNDPSEQHVILIDGQQRTTTLFLVWLFLAVNSSKKDLTLCNKFSYETRTTSKDFCVFLKTSAQSCLMYDASDSKSISDRFENSKTFFKKWRNDPTVDSMIIMLDAIVSKAKELQPNGIAVAEFDKWLDNLKKIEFEFILLEGFKRTEALYTAMNGRGKQLTDFEKLKPSICDMLKQCDFDIEDTVNNKWVPEFWAYSVEKSGERNQADKNKFAADNHDRFLFNYFKYLSTMLWLERNPFSKGDAIPSIEIVIKDLKASQDDAREFLLFAMRKFRDWFVQGGSEPYSFDSDISVEEKDSSNNKTNLFWTNHSDFIWDCVSCNEFGDFNIVKRIMLWAYLKYKWNESKQALNSKTKRDYYVLMRDIYAASWDSNTPNAITKNPTEHLIAKGLKAFKSIISGQSSADYSIQEHTFNAQNVEKYKILNNYCTRGCSNNISDIVQQQNGITQSRAESFRENIDLLIDNAGLESLKLMQFQWYINKGNMEHRLYLPCTKYMLQSIFSMGSWGRENWYNNFITDLCSVKLSSPSATYQPNQWQYYVENYYDDFVYSESLSAFDFELDANNNPRWFEIKSVYGLKATSRQIASPFCFAAYRKKMGISGKIKKEQISSFQKFAEEKNFSLLFNGTDFIWSYNNNQYSFDGTTDIIECICNKM